MDVSIITVSYNTGDLIQNCIESGFTQIGVKFEHILVDNCSTDNSQEVIKKFEPRVRFIANPVNAGFGCANNLGNTYAQGKYLYLLNPDAHFTETHTLKQLYDYMEAHPECGLIGTPLTSSKKKSSDLEPKYLYPNEQHCQQRFNNLPGDIAWVIGASMFIRKSAFDAIGGFDEDFFLYCEETDLCLRLRKAGYTIQFSKETPVAHIGSASERTTGEYALMQKKQAGLFLFMKKHYNPKDVYHILQLSYQCAVKRYRYYCFIYFFKRSKHILQKKERHRALRDTVKKQLQQIC